MGYSVDLFVNPEIEHEYICPICQEVLQNPTLVDPCEHVFCAPCLKKWKKRSRTCPVDRNPIDAEKKPNRLYINLLNNLTLRCPRKEDGCSFIVKLGDLPDHEEKCAYSPENQRECEGGCGAVLNQYERRVKSHNCVAYLKLQLEKSNTELKCSKALLDTCQQELITLKKGIPGPSSASSAPVAFPLSPSTSSSSLPRRIAIAKRYLVPPVDKSQPMPEELQEVFIRKWNVSQKMCEEMLKFVVGEIGVLQRCPEAIQTGVLKLNGNLLDRIRIRACQLCPSHRPAFLNWQVTTVPKDATYSEQDGRRGMVLKINDETVLRIVQKQY